MATIKDIATRLGVSVSTVSKGLNGASDISEELRQMVLDTAVEMGYATKKSKKKENRKLAVFIENMEYETEDQFGYDIVLGFKQNAFRHNWDVTVILVHLGRMRDKSRKVLTITEVTGMQEGEIVLKDLYRYVEKPSDGETVCGELQRVGTLFNQEKCKRAGITLPGTGE